MNASSPTIDEDSSTRFNAIFCVILSLDISKIAPYSEESVLNRVGACSSWSSSSCSSWPSSSACASTKE